jgi:hypothetical protein
MFRLVGLIMFGALCLGAPDAEAAHPVKGGRYIAMRDLGRDVVSLTRFKISVELTLANDGRELAFPSGVNEYVRCGTNDTLTDGIALDGAVDAPYRALAIKPGGRFSARGLFLSDDGRRFSLTGTFTEDGRFAVGRLVVRGGRPSCPILRLAFRAPLVGRPNAPRPGRHSVCDRVTIRQLQLSGNDETYRVYDKGVGCTTARRIARQWHASPACQHLSPGGLCHLTGATCKAVNGGQFNGLVSAHCTTTAHPHGVAEFVHYQPCTPPKSKNDASITMWSVNLGCAAAVAFPIDTLIGDPDNETGPCGAIYGLPFKAVTCTPVGGYACRARNADFDGEPGFYAVCVQQHDGFRALVFYDEI